MDYVRMAATAKRLIIKNGRAGVRVERAAVAAGPQPWKPAKAPPVLVADGIHAVFTDPRQSRGTQGEFAFEPLLRTDTTDADSLTAASTDIAYTYPTPEPVLTGDYVLTEGKRLVVLSAIHFKPAALVVFVKLFLKE